MAHDFKAQQVMDLAKAEGPYLRKIELAKELLLGEWTVVADCNGKNVIFQLVPIDEIADIRYHIKMIKERRQKEGRTIGEREITE